MPIPHLGPLVRVAALATAPILLVSCGGGDRPTGPSADQAGHNLETQVYKFLFATTTTDIKVTDTLFDKYVPCGEGKYKLTYAVTGRPASSAGEGSAEIRPAGDTGATPTEIIDDLVGFLPQVGSFNVTERQSEGSTVKLVNAKTNTRLTLHSPGPGRLVISGETDCLRKASVRTH